ncbi:MAG: twin-arginine translocation signal domain-containing protein [Candidatus Latescibacteria bacterium]|nr:twin-arginine translocation signal domain-containing protein [Candidatus Latescibacterota bacterium]NIO57430.1 twin-arginine translocation signal domain-containing protein [Candidatus Latescibacterota bacterium]
MKSDPLTSRRDFLRMGTTALAGAAFISSGACSPQPKEASQKARKLIYRALGRTGLRLPIVSMGSVYAINLVRTALDKGIVYIHTSSGYSERNHERLLGEVFLGRPRDSFVIATSPDLPYTPMKGSDRSSDIGKDVDPAQILESIEGSLRRLRLDYVDIYYLGSIGNREVTLHEPYMKAYEKLKKDGKTRFVGVVTHENEPAVIRAAAESGFWDVVLTAYNFRQSHREEVRAAIRRAAQAGLGVVAMKTQAGVYWDRTRTKKINMKAALKWVLRDKNVHTSIPAFSNYKEMEEDLSIMEDLTLTPKEKRDLELGDELGLSGCYCQQCGRCLAQCPAGMDIPTLMRSYMYAFGHQQPKKARDTLRSWTSTEIACTTCGKCDVDCSLGFDVRSRALDIARILEVPEEFLE